MIAYQTRSIRDSALTAEGDAECDQRQASDTDGVSVWRTTQEIIESTIGNHPLAAFGVALFTGVAIGWWIKRR